MSRFSTVGVVALLLLAGCSGIFGGPNVVEEECVEVANTFTNCEVVVENPENESMTVDVTATVSTKSRTERIELAPAERRTVTLGLTVAGDTTYTIDVEEVDE